MQNVLLVVALGWPTWLSCVLCAEGTHRAVTSTYRLMRSATASIMAAGRSGFAGSPARCLVQCHFLRLAKFARGRSGFSATMTLCPRKPRRPLSDIVENGSASHASRSTSSQTLSMKKTMSTSDGSNGSGAGSFFG